MNSGRRLVLIDGHALLYRAFFAFPRSLTLPDGQMVNAAFGFIRILLSTLVELKPTHLAISFDVGKTFRHEAYKEYKAHREKMPEELKSQEPIVQEILNDMNIPIYSVLNYEADDVIGTITKQVSHSVPLSGTTRDDNQNLSVLIVTGDRDMWQLINDQVSIYVPGGGKRGSKIVDRQGAHEGLGVWPEQVPDYKGLAGDGSDNIPGVRGIGPKTAVELIAEFGSLPGIYDNLEKIREGVRNKLEADKEMALMSKELATINTQVPMEFEWDACKLTAYDKEKVTATLLKYEFKSLVAALPVDAFEAEVQEALF